MRVAALVLLTACESASQADCDNSTTWNNHADGFFREHCQGCHASTSEDRYGAPANVTFDAEADVRGRADAVINALESGRMPPGGGVDDDEIERIVGWLGCE